MAAPVTTQQIWDELGRRIFACLAFVNPAGEPRTAGVVYVVADRKLYVATESSSWKARHIRGNPHVALTVTIPKRIPFMPWITIPEATINVHGTARVLACDDVDPGLLHRLLMGKADDPAARADSCVVEIEPVGRFATYGVGVTLRDMRDHTKARGHAPVA